MITVTATVAPAMRELGNVEKQIPFALSRTINRLADIVLQHTTRELLPSKLTIRSQWWLPNMKFGFRVRRSTKSSLTASVKSAADWLPRQETGDTKTASGHRVAIPTAFWKSRQELMRREKKPKVILRYLSRVKGSVALGQRALAATKADYASGTARLKLIKGVLKYKTVSKRDVIAAERRVNAGKKRAALFGSMGNPAFIQKVKGVEGIFVRTSPSRLPIKMLFRLQPSVQVHPKLEFVVSETAVVRGAMQRTLDEELRAALQSAK